MRGCGARHPRCFSNGANVGKITSQSRVVKKPSRFVARPCGGWRCSTMWHDGGDRVGDRQSFENAYSLANAKSPTSLQSSAQKSSLASPDWKRDSDHSPFVGDRIRNRIINRFVRIWPFLNRTVMAFHESFTTEKGRASSRIEACDFRLIRGLYAF